MVPSNGILATTLQQPDSSYAARSVVAVSGQPFVQAVRVVTKKTPANSYSIQLNLPTTAAVAKDDVLHAIFWLHRIAPTNGEALTEFVFEQAGSPYTQSVTRSQIEGDGQWVRFNVAFQSVAAYAAGAAQINFRLGYAPQTLEIGGFTLTNYAQTRTLASLPNDVTYPGRGADAAWRAPAAARIEQFRKADLTVQVRDTEGYPVPGAQVVVQMRRHAFGFGSAIDGGRLLGKFGTTSDRLKYQAVITNWFNKTVLENDLKWPVWEAGPPNGPGTATNALKWLLDRGIAVRGHNLIWPGTNESYFLPADVPKLFGDPAALRARIDRHFTNILTATKGRCVEWAVRESRRDGRAGAGGDGALVPDGAYPRSGRRAVPERVRQPGAGRPRSGPDRRFLQQAPLSSDQWRPHCRGRVPEPFPGIPAVTAQAHRAARPLRGARAGPGGDRV